VKSGFLTLLLNDRMHSSSSQMTTDSIEAYETGARKFVKGRDCSNIGEKVVSRWAAGRKPGTRVIEIACGGGFPVTRALLAAGLDRFPDVPAACSAVLESDFFGRKYDAAIAVGLIFLLSENDQLEMLERISEILHLGSSFLFTAPLEKGNWKDVITGHTCTSLGQKAYDKGVQQVGFKLVGYHLDSGKNNYYEVVKVRKI